MTRPLKATSRSSVRVCAGQRGAGKASSCLAKIDLYESDGGSSVRRLVTLVHRSLANIQPSCIVLTHELSSPWQGTSHKNTSPLAFMPSARRNTLYRSACSMAISGTMTCRLSCRSPLIGTETKHISSVQNSSSGCSRTKSATAVMRVTGSSSGKVPTLSADGVFGLNLFRFSKLLGLRIDKGSVL